MHLPNINSIQHFSCFFFNFRKTVKIMLFRAHKYSYGQTFVILSRFPLSSIAADEQVLRNCHILFKQPEVLLVHWIVEKCLLTFQVHLTIERRFFLLLRENKRLKVESFNLKLILSGICSIYKVHLQYLQQSQKVLSMELLQTFNNVSASSLPIEVTLFFRLRENLT